MKVGTPELDQLAVLVAIADQGSLAAAGRALGRATSVIAYQLDGLEAQLGLALFTRGTTRRPALTDAGRLVLAHARETLGNVSALQAGVAALAQGQEAELSLSVTVMFPIETLVAALTALQAHFPTLALRLHVEALGAVQARLFDGSATLAIGGALDGVNDRLVRRSLPGVPLVPVAAPGHPLTRPGIAPGEAQRHLQLVLTDRSRLTEGKDFGVLSPRSWRLGDMSAKHALLKSGAGWGNMPVPMVAADLAAGTLVQLQLPDWPGTTYPIELLHRPDHTPGPAACWLMDWLAKGGG
ncbi:LysR family transcriptional regulator [Sandarakinorhabdus cyanobacteriorum]|uniref:LysR family transcriptional regulator n=1 Tax=Sandarakinorhabdus cyanobacteriorum TaxID=1981098 RepID=UPI0013FD38B6|nr:LysR family transcriptional regulator [Sandarakinorhabdus cyanobacteriorum]